jgi:hypothetical protein
MVNCFKVIQATDSGYVLTGPSADSAQFRNSFTVIGQIHREMFFGATAMIFPATGRMQITVELPDHSFGVLGDARKLCTEILASRPKRFVAFRQNIQTFRQLILISRMNRG